MNPTSLVPIELRCAHKVGPLAVEPELLRFRWEVSGPGSARRQSAYQVRVTLRGAGPSGDSPPTWDTGRVESDRSEDVSYEGEPLVPEGRFRWEVRTWDEDGREGPWSEPANFEMAPARDAYWGSWIGLGHGTADISPPADEALDQESAAVVPPAGEGPVDAVVLAMRAPPYLRRAFRVEKAVTWARLHATALGVYQLSLNGRKVGDSVLAPGWTAYNRRILYQTYDVTGMLINGENVIGAVVADGWACSFYGFDAKRAGAHYARDPQLLARLVVAFADGSVETVVTDPEWTSSTGAIHYSDLLMGESRDASLEPTNWDRPGYDASSWRPARCHDRDGTLLLADPGPPVRALEAVPAKTVTRRADGGLIVDFGQNLAGWVSLDVDAPAGRVVRVRHGEMLANDGSLYVTNLRTARQLDIYRTTGGTEVLEPGFTFHGFRYAEITGLTGNFEPGQASARVVCSDTPRTGSFECSSQSVNQLYSNIDWGQRSNFISIPTDCPQRDERLGWLGDAQIFVRTAAYNRDVAAFFTKWLDDVSDAQLPSGAFTDFAPSLGYEWSGAPAWGDAGVIVPWTIYKMYGDRGVLERNFQPMAAWMDFTAASNPNRLRARALGNNYGDWLAPKGDFTSRQLLATAYWAYDATLMAEIATAIGLHKQATEYQELAGEIRQAFMEAYVGPEGKLASGTQTAYVMALHMSLVPDELRPVVAGHLVEAIAREDWHLTTGFVGVGYLLPVLSSNGYSDVAYRLLEQRSFPSWQYTIDRGATTIWERWDGWTEERGFQSPSMNSFNHYSLGSVGEWLYRFVLGIELAPGATAFERVVIRPHPGGSLSFARGSFQSVRGKIATSWALGAGRFTLSVEIPPNVRASVRVPSASPNQVVDGDGAGPLAVADYPGARGQMEAVFEVGSGSYSFSGPELAAG